MSSLAVYIASTKELESSSGSWVRLVDDHLHDVDDVTPEQARRARPPKFRAALQAVPAATPVRVVLRDPGDLEGHVGTHRLRPFFAAAQVDHTAPIELHTTPPVDGQGNFYTAVEKLLDEWSHEGYGDIHLFLSGDSAADVMATLSALRGTRMPVSITLHRHRVDAFGDHTFELVDAGARISRELTREHAAARIRDWEFEEVRALTQLHGRDFEDVTELLEATHAYLHRNRGPLEQLGLLQAPQDARWTATRQLAHTLDLAEHAMTVGRDEEQVAWYVMLALLELGPMAWAEHWLADRVTTGAGLQAAIREWSSTDPDGLATGRAIAVAHGNPNYAAPAYDAAALLLRAGPPLRDPDSGRSIVPDDVLADGDRADAAATLWLALRYALRDTRNRFAHGFVDISPDELVNDLLEDGRAATRSAVEALLCTDAPGEGTCARVHAVLYGPADPTSARHDTPAARAAARRLEDPRPLTREQAEVLHEQLCAWATEAQASSPPFLAAIAARIRRDLPAYGAEVDKDLRRLAGLETLPEDRAGPVRDRLRLVLRVGALVPARLDGNEVAADTGLRAVVSVFSPLAARMPRPLIGARTQLLGALAPESVR